MVENKQDELARAYTMLKSLRSNIGQMTTNRVPETYVHEFHTVLSKLEDMGMDVADFRVPASEIAPNVESINTITGQTSYTTEQYVDKTFLLFKLDAILGYFEIITSEKPRKIGFSK